MGREWCGQATYRWNYSWRDHDSDSKRPCGRLREGKSTSLGGRSQRWVDCAPSLKKAAIRLTAAVACLLSDEEALLAIDSGRRSCYFQKPHTTGTREAPEPQHWRCTEVGLRATDTDHQGPSAVQQSMDSTASLNPSTVGDMFAASGFMSPSFTQRKEMPALYREHSNWLPGRVRSSWGKRTFLRWNV